MTRQRIGFSMKLWQCQAAQRSIPGLFDIQWSSFAAEESDRANCVSNHWCLIVMIARPKRRPDGSLRRELQSGEPMTSGQDSSSAPSSFVDHDRPIVAKKMRQPYRAGPMRRLVALENTLCRLRDLWRILTNDFMTCPCSPRLTKYIFNPSPRPASDKLIVSKHHQSTCTYTLLTSHH